MLDKGDICKIGIDNDFFAAPTKYDACSSINDGVLK